jgi:hypothetical protein
VTLNAPVADVVVVSIVSAPCFAHEASSMAAHSAPIRHAGE